MRRHEINFTTEYPTDWPPTFPRTPARDRKPSPFAERTFTRARDELMDELRLMGADDVILSTGIPVRMDGHLAAGRNRSTDPAVAVYFQWLGQRRAMACDKWSTVEHNLTALAHSINAMRGLDRWGASQILQRAFTGFTALPAPAQWWDVLGVSENASLAVIEESYKREIFKAHPDRGGSEGRASNLNWAVAEARKARGAA